MPPPSHRKRPPRGAKARTTFSRPDSRSAESRSTSDSGLGNDGTVWLPGRKGLLEILRHAPERLLQVKLADGATLSAEFTAAFEQLTARGIPLDRVPAEQVSALCGGTVHQGIVSEVTPNSFVPLGEVIRRAVETTHGLVVFLDEVTDPHNTGAILRAADAFGASGVVWTTDRAAPLTSVTRKVSAGASELLLLSRVTNLARALDEARDSGFWILGADVHESSALPDLEPAYPMALVLGSEGRGLRRLTKERCDQLAHIPMIGHVESLNVGQAAAVFLSALRARVPREA